MYSPTSYEVIKAQQGDNKSRIIEFVLYNHGKPYTISNNISIKLEGHRGDNSSFIKDCTITDNIITAILDGDILYEAGTVEAKIVLYDISNDTILSTIPFRIHVQKNPCDKNKLAAEKHSVIDWLILNFEKLKDSLFKHIENKDNPHGVTKKNVGLGNVDDTSDMDKPVSTAQQTALNKKANIESPTLTGTPKAPTASTDNTSTQIATTAFTQTIVSNHNTSTSAHGDIRNLISELTRRLNALADSDDTTLDQLSEIVAYIKSNRSLIENVTTTKINVSDIVDNLTSTTANKPLSANQGKVLNDLIATLTAIVNNKVDKADGKGLSTNDYTDEEKSKVASIFSGSVTGVKGNAETEYRSGNVNITPADIGALSLSENSIVTGEAAFRKGIAQVNIASNRAESGYMKICRFTIHTAYANAPIEFDLVERNHIGTIYICFNSTSIQNTNLQSFEYRGVLDGVPYLHKVETGVWDLYVRATEWYGATITNLKFGKHQSDRMTIDFYENEFITTENLPDGGVNANLMSYNVKSAKSVEAETSIISEKLARNGDPSTPMTFYWQGKNEQPTWLWGGNDGSSMYVYNPDKIKCGSAKISDISDKSEQLLDAITISYPPESGKPNITYYMSFKIEDENHNGIRLLQIGSKGRSDFLFTHDEHAANFYGLRNLTPGTANLGTSNYKWANIYASTSTITTSDKNEKKDIEDLDDDKTVDFIMGLKPKSFRFIDGNSGRTHYGLISQDVEKLLEQLGMSTLDFAGFIKSPKTKTVEKEIEQEVEKDGKIVVEKIKVSEDEVIENEYVYGLRYEEFIGIILKMQQIQQQELSKLKDENEVLKSKIKNIESTLEVIQNHLTL